jgi:Carboxypeptidase regulatory-like domain
VSLLLIGTCVRPGAQVVGATLSGTLMDSLGAIIANGRVEVTNTGTGVTTPATTNNEGFYTIPNLAPGTYDGVFSAPGFATPMQKGVTLTVGQNQLLNVSLSVGSGNSGGECHLRGSDREFG